MRALIVCVVTTLIGISGCTPQKAENRNLTVVKDSVTSVFIPESLQFAGEKVPLDSIEVRERLERELVVNKYKHSSTILIIKRGPRYKGKILKILKEEGVPEDFYYLAAIESEFDPYADSGYAAGFWQFTPGAAKDFNLEISDYVEQRYDLEASTRAACQWLKKAKERLGTWTLAAAAYNRGITGIERIRDQQRESSYYSLYLNTETSRYVFRILAIKLIMENPEAYGYFIKEDEKYKLHETKKIEITNSIEDLAAFAHSLGINYKILKYHNPWINFNPITRSKGVYKKEYRFEVPKGKVYYFEIPVSAKNQ